MALLGLTLLLKLLTPQPALLTPCPTPGPLPSQSPSPPPAASSLDHRLCRAIYLCMRRPSMAVCPNQRGCRPLCSRSCLPVASSLLLCPLCDVIAGMGQGGGAFNPLDIEVERLASSSRGVPRAGIALARKAPGERARGERRG